MRRIIRSIMAALGMGLPGGKIAVEAQDCPAPLEPVRNEAPAEYSLTPSLTGIELIIDFETGGREYYEKKLAAPSWPGGASGVTIGVGYDLGYHTREQIAADWAFLPANTLDKLLKSSGLKGSEALHRVWAIKGEGGVTIPWDVAIGVFQTVTLPRWAKLTREAYPGAENLPPDAQAALISLCFNRGTSKDGDRRREMKALTQAVAEGDLERIANLIRSMKRLWRYRGLDGLLTRRDREAALVDSATMAKRDDLVYV